MRRPFNIDAYDPIAEATAEASRRDRTERAHAAGDRRRFAALMHERHAPVSGVELLAELFVEDPEAFDRQWDEQVQGE